MIHRLLAQEKRVLIYLIIVKNIVSIESHIIYFKVFKQVCILDKSFLNFHKVTVFLDLNNLLNRSCF